ncbi:MAG: hypothetical protein P8Z68_00430 [Kineosporiaceae bacterium]
MLFPVRLIAGRWPRAVERPLRRFTWLDPRLVQDPGTDPATFSRAMAAFAVGSTRKITGSGRHAAADALLLEHLDLSGAVIVDIGASDGSTSVELATRLDGFARYLIADLYLEVHAVRTRRHTVFLDGAGTVVVVAGPRTVAWPALSPLVALLYRPTLARASRLWRSGSDVRTVPLVNPATRDLLAGDPRLELRTHDIFTPWSGPRPDLIKVANVLRRLYFTDSRILAALTVILGDLPDGGHLLLVDNPRVNPPTEDRGCLYRKDGDRFTLVGRTGQPTEVHELVLRVREPRTRQVQAREAHR